MRIPGLFAGAVAVLLGCLSAAGLCAAEGVAGPKLLVVAPKAFHATLENFMQHKAGLIPAELVSLEAVLEETPGADDPEKLKRYLFREWEQSSLRYVLLVGDVDVFPARFMVLDRVTPEAFDYAFYVSDLYYADLAKRDGSFEDWNARKDGIHGQYYGEVRGEKNKSDPINYDAVDYLPEIAVGRWPVSTVDELKIVAAKTIDYEKSVRAGTSPHLRRAAFISVGEWVDSRPFMDRTAGKLSGKWAVQKRYYQDDKERYKGISAPTRKEVKGLFNDGLGLAVHAGHGQPDSWEQCFLPEDAFSLGNEGKLGVVLSAGCSTAHFAPEPPYEAYMDVNGKAHRGTRSKEVFTEAPPAPSPYQKGKFNPTGLGEQLLKRSANGAVAYFGCNTGSQPCGLTLVGGFVDEWTKLEKPRLGDCWAGAIRHYWEREKLAELKPTESWYPPSIFFQGMKFLLFGDPSLELPAN